MFSPTFHRYMRYTAILFMLFFQFRNLKAQNQPCREVIGYYPNWQWYDRSKLVKPSSIDYSKYTIINYAFFKPELSGAISSTDTWADDNLLNGQPNWAQGGYYPNTSIVSRAHNAGVKILPSIGGWTLSDNFPVIAADPVKRTNFANACVQLINQYQFDGIDLDWEYPGYVVHGGSPADKNNFTLLLQSVRSALTNLGNQNGKTYLLTSCFGASQAHMNNIDWPAVVPLLDCINLMSYDFFGAWDNTTNHNSPLYAPAQGDPTFNINSAVNSLVTTYNVPAQKICAGLAFYGRSFKTPSAPQLHGPASGSGDTATFSEDDGTPLYYNVLKKLNLFDQYRDNLAVSPYLLGKNGLKTFLSYDDSLSIFAKAAYVRNKNLRGCIIWEITGDYIETTPGSGVIAGTPLATAVNKAFCGSGGNTTICQVPAQVAAQSSATTATVTWAASGAASYDVQYKPSSGSLWTTQTVGANSISLSNLSSGQTYQVQVRAVCSSTQSSAYSTPISFSTNASGGGAGGSICSAPATFYFNSSNYQPTGEIKIGQGRLNPIWGVSVDAYIPANRKSWAISMAHAAHLFRNVVKTDKIPANFYFATAAKESFCGCDVGIQASPSGTPFPFTYQSSSLGDGCFQIENNSAYNELVQQYPQRFPVGQHANLIGGGNFETAALSKAYYDIFTVKYWEVHKNWNPIGFFNTASDPDAAVKLMAVAYNRGLWYTELGTVLNSSRSSAISASSISPYFVNNNYGYDYQNALTNYTRILGNNLAGLSTSLFTTNPATGQPYNSFNGFYDPQISWTDVNDYIERIKVLYPSVNFTTLKSQVQTVFNSQNGGNPVSFRYAFGKVLDALIMGLPADDPSSNIATIYGCASLGQPNQSPVVSLGQPSANQVFSAYSSVNIAAAASDPDGSIAKVEFYQGTQLLAVVNNAPFAFTWNNVTPGDYQISAKAYDNLGASAVSTSIKITVNAPAPECIITSPTDKSRIMLPADITINVKVNSFGIGVINVNIYNKGVLIKSIDRAPYQYIWVKPPVGTYVLTAVAVTVSKTTIQSAPVTFDVVPQVVNTPPTISITQPLQNAVFWTPAQVNIAANAADVNGFVSKVDFYSGNTFIGSDNIQPFTTRWNTSVAGTYTITAVATDNQGATTRSAPVQVVVQNNILPVCSIQQPVQNQTYTEPATVSIAAQASDADGTVVKVDFYNGAQLLGTDNTAPYSFSWQNVPAGTYSIIAKASDNRGGIGAATAVSIVVQSNIPPCTQYQQYVEAAPYNVNSYVSNNGGVYKCNVPGWCSGPGWAYAPGLGTAWQDAWVKTSNCVQSLPDCSTVNPYFANTAYTTGSIVKSNAQLYTCNIPSWCSGSASFYAPGAGSAWQQAWTLMGPCPNGSSRIRFDYPGEQFNLFPNPAASGATLRINDAPEGKINIRMTDISGRLLYEKSVDNRDSMLSTEIDLSNLPGGIYRIEVESSIWNKGLLLRKWE